MNETKVVSKERELELLRFRLQELLQSNIVAVTFTKVDGTERVMNCTLDSAKMPEYDKPTDIHERAVNPNVLPVWDVDKNGWRSFILDGVSDFIATRRKR
jgi:hypothetical protein